MSVIKQQLPKEEKDAATKERERLMILLMSNSARMASDYRNTIKHTGGILTSSMSFAYAKGLNDALKLLTTKEEKNEESVQTKEG